MVGVGAWSRSPTLSPWRKRARFCEGFNPVRNGAVIKRSGIDVYVVFKNTIRQDLDLFQLTNINRYT